MTSRNRQELQQKQNTPKTLVGDKTAAGLSKTIECCTERNRSAYWENKK